MSADNWIYIWKFKDWYRTTIWFAVDNLDFYKKWTFLWSKTVRDFFKDWHFSSSFEDALKYANKLEETYWWTEYWICEVWDFSEYNIFNEEDTFEITEETLLLMWFQKIELVNEEEGEDEDIEEWLFCYHLELDKWLNLYIYLNWLHNNVILEHWNYWIHKTYLQINSLLELKNLLYVFDVWDKIDISKEY